MFNESRPAPKSVLRHAYHDDEDSEPRFFKVADGGASLAEETLLRFLLGVLLVALFLQRLADLLGIVLAG